jgi:PAT family beta-lactamase induction signal transducer AmpG
VLSFVLYWPNRGTFGSGQAILGTFYTLVFVASALFLLAGREVLGDAAGRYGHAALWIAPLLLAMYGRYWIEKLTGPLGSLAQVLLYATPLAGGLLLLALSRMDWRGGTVIEPDPALTPVR